MHGICLLVAVALAPPREEAGALDGAKIHSMVVAVVGFGGVGWVRRWMVVVSPMGLC